MILYNELLPEDENKNEKRIEILIDDSLEASLTVTDASVEEAFEYIEDHKATAYLNGDSVEYTVWVFDPQTNKAKVLEPDSFYNFTKLNPQQVREYLA